MNTQQILGKLIGFRTVSDQPTTELIAWVDSFLREKGATVEILLANEGGKASLWARLGPDVAGGVVLAGHVDVVPTEGQVWTSDPFVMTEDNGKLYGRGACDMKGFLACVLSFAGRVDMTTLSKPLYIALTYDEETNMAGAAALSKQLAERKIQTDWVWLGEPTELEVVTAHKGVVCIETFITGAAGHASLPDKGLNAIVMANKIINWVQEEGTAYAAQPISGSPFAPPYSTTNIGTINGGKASNIIADTCVLKWESRIHPEGKSAAELIKDYETFIEKALRPMMQKFPQAGLKTNIQINVPPFSNSADNIGEQFLISRTGTGHTLAVSYATEAGYYQAFAKNVVICGPGSITKAHQADEYITLSDLKRCDKLLDLLGQSLCNKDPSVNKEPT